VVFTFLGDSISLREGHRNVSVRRVKKTATINSSLWGAIMAEKLPYALAAELEAIYEWTIDFFSIQPGDKFTVIYDEKFIDTVSIGVERIWGAKFTHRKKELYAIPFKQNGKVKYWGKDGSSLRKQLLMTPLKFTRISSGFTNARLHPVLKVYRPHHGIDYAAPIGTPVRAVADGVVIQKGYRGAAGNMLKIKHSGDLTSGYMHLSKFGKGIENGTRVTQGQVIGYVGSTGRSTGAHLDFRLWKGATPVNPANVTQQLVDPIAKKDKGRFENVKELIIAELEGDVPDSMKLKEIR
jgi:murein DD-endopeptidase MepM/ murein hydrolase activator NlpD